jgi:hypothetical protein
MINFYDQVPQVYNNASRDFQYLSWLINVVLNSVKHNVDDMYNLPNVKTDPKLTELLALTLGFKVKRNYNQEQLAALVSIIPSILKYKGTTKAISLAGNALIKASGSNGVFKCEITNNCLEIQLPGDLVDVVLFTDLLQYIAPAGLTTRVVASTEVQTKYITELKYKDVPKAAFKPVLAWDNSTDHKITGLATLYDVGTQEVPEFSNFMQGSSPDDLKLNSGLLSNSIIIAPIEPIKTIKSPTEVTTSIEIGDESKT